MSLIKCPECQKEVSDKAKTCIHCGCPIQIEIEKENFLSFKNKTFKDLTLEERKSLDEFMKKNNAYPNGLELLSLIIYIIALILLVYGLFSSFFLTILGFLFGRNSQNYRFIY